MGLSPVLPSAGGAEGFSLYQALPCQWVGRASISIRGLLPSSVPRRGEGCRKAGQASRVGKTPMGHSNSLEELRRTLHPSRLPPPSASPLHLLTTKAGSAGSPHPTPLPKARVVTGLRGTAKQVKSHTQRSSSMSSSHRPPNRRHRSCSHSPSSPEPDPPEPHSAQEAGGCNEPRGPGATQDIPTTDSAGEAAPNPHLVLEAGKTFPQREQLIPALHPPWQWPGDNSVWRWRSLC